MFQDMLRDIDPTPEELKANESFIQICEFNQFNILGLISVVHAYQGFNRELIAEKVNALASPFNLSDSLVH